jgi:virginiamycin A acetyltransferase
MLTHPNPKEPYPIEGIQRTVYLNNLISSPLIEVGDYTYYDDPEDVHNFEKNVLYHFDFIGDKLRIGKFCQIATGVRFIMNGSNHPMEGFSTYPFKIFGHSWQNIPMTVQNKGDTLIGNDVWIGNGVTIMQGVSIGDGAIIGTGSLVTKDVDPYTVVAGNPATLIRKRFSDEIIDQLLCVKWWDWDLDLLAERAHAIAVGDLKALASFSKEIR